MLMYAKIRVGRPRLQSIKAANDVIPGWFLPSKDQLLLLYNNKDVVGICPVRAIRAF
jgi:hypothetical protein